MEKKQRSYSIDVIKTVATILILFHHYQQVTGAVFDGINFYNGKFYFGWIVELFFVISGYVMFSYIEKIDKDDISFAVFMKRRFIRLFPVVTMGL